MRLYCMVSGYCTGVYLQYLYLNKHDMTHCRGECCCMLVASLYCLTLLGSLGLCPSAVERETSTPARGKEIIKSAMFTCRSGAGGVGAREGVRGMVCVRAALLARRRFEEQARRT